MDSGTKDDIPILSCVATVYLIVIGILALIR
jgi:hypothetical protein